MHPSSITTISSLGLTLYADDRTVTAHIGDTEVGTLELNQEEDDGRFWVWNVEVKDECQRKGIGRVMVDKANDEFGEIYFSKASKSEYQMNGLPDSTCYLSEEGAALAASCVNNGIISAEQFINPFADIYFRYDDES